MAFYEQKHTPAIAIHGGFLCLRRVQRQSAAAPTQSNFSIRRRDANLNGGDLLSAP